MDELLNIGFVIFGGFIGAAIITLFPYFMDKSKREEAIVIIRDKTPETRTPEEKFLLENKLPGFFDEYKYRFSFGIIGGIGLVLAFLANNIDTVSTYTSGGAFVAGMTASGFFSALADKIRAK